MKDDETREKTMRVEAVGETDEGAEQQRKMKTMTDDGH